MTEQTLGKYRILAELGRGAFATVYKARDTTLDRVVALKILHPQLLVDPDFVTHFQREARALAGLRHPCIVTIYEIGEADDRIYLAIEYANGPSLGQAIAERGAFPWAEVLTILQPVGRVLEYAHNQGIVHRDLKPANILLDHERGPLLSDFGFAQLVGQSSVSVSLSGGVIGTPQYIAPEIWEDQPASPQTDIYALGCVLYEMATGKQLFAGESVPAIMHAHFEPLQLPDTWPEGVPTSIADVLRTALAADPAQRYTRAGDLVADLQRLVLDRLATPYAALEKAVQAGRWDEAIRLAEEISQMEANYRDTAELGARALAGKASAAQVAQPETRPRTAKEGDRPGATCPNCGATNVTGARFCTTCGQPMATPARKDEPSRPDDLRQDIGQAADRARWDTWFKEAKLLISADPTRSLELLGKIRAECPSYPGLFQAETRALQAQQALQALRVRKARELAEQQVVGRKTRDPAWSPQQGSLLSSAPPPAESTPSRRLRLPRWVWGLAVVLALGITAIVLILSSASPTPTPATVPTPIPTVDRQGAWVDSVIMVEEPNASAAITRLESGELDVYAYAISDAELYKRVQESPELAYALSYGSYNDLTFNPAGPVFSGSGMLNPFAVPAIREAMNWLIDRDYIAQEIFGGLAVPRFVAFGGAMPDYAKNADLIRAIAIEYAYDPEKAKEVIDAEMTALGATLKSGKWTYNGQPVTLIFLIRIEDERMQIGDYIANQLESIGFTVDRQYKPSADCSALWVRTDPAEGLWHLYTGGWVSTAISRDEGGNFSFFYTDQQYPIPLFLSYQNTPEFYDICLKLLSNDFTTLEERTELMRTALDLSLEDSNRVWLVDRISFSPRRADIEVSADLSASVYGSALWAYTLRRTGQVGGSITIGTTGILTDPWNPIAGTNWVYDRMPQRGTGETALVPDPYTGLNLPMRIEKAECVVQEGLPVGTSSDWLELEFASSIEVPTDAWVDWDAANQQFITAGQVSGTRTARTKCTVYYPADMFETVKWHDGSSLSIADFVMAMILTFDPGKPESPIYDAAYAPRLASFLSHFKGLRIVSTAPLVVETYDDYWTLDAEHIVNTWWPSYAYGQAPWHTLVPALQSEADGQLAFSSYKADTLEIEWTSFIAGPSIDILNSYLVTVADEDYIPYARTMRQFLSTDEAAARYANLTEWVRTKGHYWLGTGPFYLERAFPLEGTLILKRNTRYPDQADRWDRFSEARIAAAEVSGADTVTIGKEASFYVALTFNGEPYPIADIDQVKYLVIDAKGQLATSGAAHAVADGQWKITLEAAATSKLAAGANRLEIAVAPKAVSLPTFASKEFITVP